MNIQLQTSIKMSQQCQATVIGGRQCKRGALKGGKYCHQHKTNTVTNIGKKAIETLDDKVLVGNRTVLIPKNYLPRLPIDIREELLQYLPISDVELLLLLKIFLFLGIETHFIRLYIKKFSPIIPTVKVSRCRASACMAQ